MGQDQESGGVSVLCWLAAPVAMFYGNLQNSVTRSKDTFKSREETFKGVRTSFKNFHVTKIMVHVSID